MTIQTKTFPGGLKKAFTLSYDDGVEQDKRLVKIFNKYGLKSTFNINSGIQSRSNSWVTKTNVTVRRMDVNEIEELYRNHEIAVHSLTHPHLENMTEEEVFHELSEDKKNLEKLFGYPVRGMAYPFGTYNELVKSVMKKVGIEYSRTVKQHCTFALPENFLEWHPTCHHANERLLELAKEFVNSESEELQLFYVWGHSYEFDEHNNWDVIEELCSFISNRTDIWYATNLEIMDCLT